ncbi:MAG: hypothetical protein A2664_01825 [Candidatus Taylorbacteria bacterium RIFCSPHIGHO2_01_FULL_46_22b]|uniref:Uncharacterized protein n=1 Tax=Candidatus Taylorbacteria bacterium RIFCSPHIGHO2_01_FULL_46_22b TaxID=1802301 RepID=A0A1G2M516_9BACT|nr:MAG: hypothetical protein A2664_01825 [Candidatus Taylorbacteria bacterium RIFCSPHIGHO2_01_FULL_46_22b]
MSQREHNKAVISELQKINEMIDRKIIRGENYRMESKRHFELLRMLKRARSRWNLHNLLSALTLF